MERRFRLRRGEDFARLRREGRVYHHRFMTVSLAANGLPYNRYGFITAKHLGKAVSRNRVRRLFREAVRQLHPRLQPGFDVVMIARQPLVEQPLTVVYRTVSDLLDRAGIVLEDGSA
jgi:ribonuclease P protein component